MGWPCNRAEAIGSCEDDDRRTELCDPLSLPAVFPQSGYSVIDFLRRSAEAFLRVKMSSSKERGIRHRPSEASSLSTFGCQSASFLRFLSVGVFRVVSVGWFSPFSPFLFSFLGRWGKRLRNHIQHHPWWHIDDNSQFRGNGRFTTTSRATGNVDRETLRCCLERRHTKRGHAL